MTVLAQITRGQANRVLATNATGRRAVVAIKTSTDKIRVVNRRRNPSRCAMTRAAILRRDNVVRFLVLTGGNNAIVALLA